MADKEPIAQIDNSLKELYNTSIMNKFDGFGDYACIVASLPSTGGAISPAGVYYSNDNNFFVAFKGRTAQLSEFPERTLHQALLHPNIGKNIQINITKIALVVRKSFLY